MKKLRFDAVSYVLENGNAHHKLQTLILLGGNVEEQRRLTRELKSLQNPDGGWPWQLKKGNASGISQTARTLQLLWSVGEKKDSESSKRAVSFLLKEQNPDGGWSENPELEDTIPKESKWISTKYSGFQTADAIIALIEAGYLRDERVKNAVDFLRKTQNEEGGWPSYVGPDYPYEGSDVAVTDHIVLAFLKFGEPKNSLVIKNAVKALVKHRESWKEPVDAATALCVFLTLDYPVNHEYVEELGTNLVETQRPDGGWNYFGDLPSNPGQTLYCMEQLLKCGVEISRQPSL